MDFVSLIIRYLKETWWLTSEMAPYLVLGFVIAGVLRAFFTEEWVRRHLGQKGLYQIVKAVIIGIPLPLCSCGVIPVAASIRRQGGSRGAVAAFTAATPQTGVDAIAATVGMLGWVFAIVRVIIAFINGIVAGLVVEKWGDGNKAITATEEEDCCDSSEESCCASTTETSCCCESETESCCSGSEDPQPEENRLAFLLSGLKFGLVTLPRDLFGALVVGLLLAGAISTFIPQDFFSNIPGGQFGVYLGMTLISLPLYICSTGSIPMAFTFLQSGLSPGAVLIFLIAGPASNAATVTSLWKIIGGRATVGYILSIIATCWVAAITLDFSGLSLMVTQAVHHHDMGVNLFQQLMGGLLVAILVFSRLGQSRITRSL
ncbi:SO_0444 family Cu/Zn efflux transporter [Puniceicoccales bacterium CK1056]|uniref:SO_0444 family Cu/Zn efflux transporter n=1 Tax=Oceanipulchritudo coccoides TaxID=2706888 RepID=A0A6B2M502_9BACT|nr:SO_0444 family Cu/Zn efflux transporter [Oceanipulchritudo coccoides]NDV63167.1 SO_0444 family Cu/Zn efflux transporter [Oceanipulchritudo coccoides]